VRRGKSYCTPQHRDNDVGIGHFARRHERIV
jgi:hypothetical protein